MLDALKFVRGSVNKTDAALSHFRIKDGRVTGFNGVLAISSPIPTDIECQPDATSLTKAISNCKGTVELSMTPSGKLRVKSGGFRAFINCYDRELPRYAPLGVPAAVDGTALLEAMGALLPFVGDDPARSWCNGVIFSGKSALATNNIAAAEAWIGSTFPAEANVPGATVRELLRIGIPPERVAIHSNSMTFFFEGDRWLRTQLYAGAERAEIIRKLFKAPTANLRPFPKGFWEAIDAVLPFRDKLGRVFFRDGHVRTSEHDDEGAMMKVAGLPDAIFNIDIIKLLQDNADKIDFAAYPRPCLFISKRVRGAIVGMQ